MARSWSSRLGISDLAELTAGDPAPLPAVGTAPRAASGLDLRVARGADDAARLRDAWIALATTPTADLDLYLALAAAPPGFEPWAALIERDGAPRVLAAGRREPYVLRARLARRVLLATPLRALVFPRGAVCGEVGREEARVVVAALRSALDRGEAEVAVLCEIAVDSPLFAELRRAGGLARDLVPDRNLRWTAALPDSYADFLRARSPRLRKTLRHAANRLERELGGRLEVRRYETVADVDRFFRDVEAIAARTYQRRLGVGFRDAPATRVLAFHAARRGWLRAWVLVVDGEPAAFTWGLRRGDTYDSADTGYDPRFRVGVGDYLMNREIADLCLDPSIRRFDFGFGDATYKRRYADTAHPEATVRLFASRPRAALANGARGIVAGADRGLRAAAAWLRLLDPLRRRVRDAALRTAAASAPRLP